MDEQTQAQIKQQNEEIRKEREKIIDGISMKFSCFKRDFLGAPMRRALKSLSECRLMIPLISASPGKPCLFRGDSLQD